MPAPGPRLIFRDLTILNISAFRYLDLTGPFQGLYDPIVYPCIEFGVQIPRRSVAKMLVSCLIYARALLEYVVVIVWVRSVNKMLPSVKFAEVLTYFP